MWQTMFQMRLGALQASLDRLLMPAQAAPEGIPAEGEKKGFPTWAIILIVAVVLLCCLLPICIIAILQFLGPGIQNIFEGITDSLSY